ncbi:MAG: sialidase family protein [Myxococcota bacterium]
MRSFACVLVAMAGCVRPDGDTKTPASEAEDETGPLAIEGYGDDVAIAPDVGWSQAEPSAVALEDGTVLAAWMHIEDSGGMWIRYSRSEDGGLTWSDPEKIDDDRYGYQNDPVLVAGGGYVYFTWLAVEGSYERLTIYCSHSTDGGRTWSDRVRLTEANTTNDRQWMDVADDGRVVMTWDHFPSGNTEQQLFVESPGGCENFGEIETVADGYFLNGVPAIDADGQIWASRHAITGRGYDTLTVFLSKKTEDGWEDAEVFEGDANFLGEAEDVAEDPAEEMEEREEHVEEALARDPLALLDRVGPHFPRAVADGEYDGTYSPTMVALPGGGLAIASLLYEDGEDVADVRFATVRDGEVVEQVLNQDGAGNPQAEPWLAVDPGGGIHAAWFDARSGKWQLLGATSLDGGETWNEYEIGDTTFRKGFDDSDPSMWVGHYQALTATSSGVVAVWGDTRDGEASWIHADRAEP